MEGFSIRQARENEGSTLTRLALRSKALWGYPADFMRMVVDELRVSEQRLACGHTFVAEDASGLLGFHAVAPVAEDAWELDFLFVDPAHVRRGIGRALFEHAARHAAAQGGTRLMIQGDPNAERFYRRCGAVRIGTRPSESIPGRVLPLFVLEPLARPPTS